MTTKEWRLEAGKIVFTDPQIGLEDLIAELKSRGFDMSDDEVKRHRYDLTRHARTGALQKDGSVNRRMYRKSAKKYGLRYSPAIWGRRPDETDTEFSLYRSFRDLEPEERSWVDYVEAVSARISEEELAALAEDKDWANRIEAWDSSSRARLAFRAGKESRRMKKQHGDLGAAMLGVAARELKRWNDRDPGEPPMPVGGLVSLATTGVAIERMSKDLPTEIIEERTKSKVDFGKLSLEDLKTIRALKQKIAKPEESGE